MSESTQGITLLLHQVQCGDRQAREELYRLVEHQLRVIAAGHMRHERPDHTLQPTVLVHDAFLQLVGDGRAPPHDRAHFYRAAARAMRHILVDHQRARLTQKRGGAAQRRVAVELDQIGRDPFQTDLLALDEALQRLAELDPRQGEIVDLHHFGGWKFAEVAEMLGVSISTVKAEWAAAKAWLHQEISRGEDLA